VSLQSAFLQSGPPDGQPLRCTFFTCTFSSAGPGKQLKDGDIVQVGSETKMRVEVRDPTIPKLCCS